MKSLIIYLVTVYLMIHSSIGQDQCKNYYDQTGICVPIASCKSLHQLEQNLNKSFDDQLLINGNICGSSRAEKKVCCTDSGTIGLKESNRAPFGIVNIGIASIPMTSTRTTTTERTVLDETTTKRVTVTTARPASVLVQNTASGLLPIPGDSNCGLHFPDRIYGGSVTAIDEHPWLARLDYTYTNGAKEFRCAGSLINDRYVLTAAHCIPKTSDDYSLTGVRLGEWNAATVTDCYKGNCADPPQDIAIEQIIAHPEYVIDSKDFYHDIALLRLATSAKFSTYVRTICLPSKKELRTATDFQGKTFTVSGWGETETAYSSDLKLRVDLDGVSLDTCNWVWRHKNNPITERQICAGGQAGKDTCGGDSGGPLMLLYSDGEGTNYVYVAGIVSYGRADCAQHNWPGIYTNVGSYMDWIEANIKA